MIQFGNDLKAAREAKGLSIADIAERTHMMSAMVEDLENENFHRIVAPIYGRGFVKLYCETVGLEAKPYIDEFMAIYSGNRDPAIRERVTPTAVPVSEPVPMSEPIPEPTIEPEPLSEPIPVIETPMEAPIETPIETPIQKSLFDPPTEEPAPKTPKFTHYSAPLRDHSANLPELGPTLARWGVLVAVAILVLWGLIACIRALYRATSRPTETKPTTVEEVVETAPAAPIETTPKAEPRTALDIPPLYID